MAVHQWQIDPEHWGKGYAPEIGPVMLVYGFQEAGFPVIMGFAFTPCNIKKSQAVRSPPQTHPLQLFYLHISKKKPQEKAIPADKKL